MTRTQQTALAAGAATIGAALVTRALRAARRTDFSGKVVVITGARGLALSMARQLGQEGARILLAARDQGELDRARDELRAKGVEISTFACDLMNRQAVEELVEQAVKRYGAIDVLINNAGVIQVGPIDHMVVADFEEAMAVHFWAPLHAMLAAIPHMRQQGGGRIVNISSIGGRVGVPHLAPYCASKFALTGVSDALRAELADDRITVTTVLPGLMRTGSPFNAWFKGRHRDEFTWFAVSDSIPGITIDAARAAWQVIDACRHGDAELVITWPARLAIIANAVAPEAVALGMSIANRVLPGPTDDRSGDERHSGWQSASRWAPSRLTTLSERAAAENNELPH
ncbi:MAG TPA: SDR family oxidoreductase [Vicinamibacterales bacterium]|nr:SDR family oxidoreductase [Vicinamibacterales bacterium]